MTYKPPQVEKLYQTCKHPTAGSVNAPVLRQAFRPILIPKPLGLWPEDSPWSEILIQSDPVIR